MELKWERNEWSKLPIQCESKNSIEFFLYFYQTKCKRSLGLFPAPLCSPLFPNTKENSCTITCLMHIKPQIYERVSTTTSSREILLSSKFALPRPPTVVCMSRSTSVFLETILLVELKLFLKCKWILTTLDLWSEIP